MPDYGNQFYNKCKYDMPDDVFGGGYTNSYRNVQECLDTLKGN